MWVKICGVRSPEQARHAAACGADAIGFNLYPPSPRSVTQEVAAGIAAAARAASVPAVMVVVDRALPDLLGLIARIRPALVQLHGGEPPELAAALPVPVLRALRARPGVLEQIAALPGTDEAPRRFLLDAWRPGQPGGTGARVEPALAGAAAGLGQMILAGGLDPSNVAGAIRDLRAAEAAPWGVDVASGVERRPGEQDPVKVAEFVRAAKGA